MVFFSRENSPRTKDGAYVINLHDKQCKEIHWVSLFIDRHTAAYFDSFETEHFPEEVLNKIKGKSLYTTYLKYKIKILLCGDFTVSFQEIYDCGKNFFILYQFILP